MTQPPTPVAPGWYPAPDGLVRFWDGQTWGAAAAQPPAPQQAQPSGPVVVNNNYGTPQAARTAHGPVYWAFVGWWWGPAKWLGRVLLWVFLLPVGIWRSVRHSQQKKELKQRRGYR